MIYQGNSLNRANNIQAKALDYAFGGDINNNNMGALEYNFINDYLSGFGKDKKKKKSE